MVRPSVVAVALSVGVVTRNSDFPEGDGVISRTVTLLAGVGSERLEPDDDELNGNGMVCVVRSESEE
jgi:hypothetical protein